LPPVSVSTVPRPIRAEVPDARDLVGAAGPDQYVVAAGALDDVDPEGHGKRTGHLAQVAGGVLDLCAILTVPEVTPSLNDQLPFETAAVPSRTPSRNTTRTSSAARAPATVPLTTVQLAAEATSTWQRVVVVAVEVEVEDPAAVTATA
jgi:hypothetical protein